MLRNGFGRIMLRVPATVPAGLWTIRIENDFLSLGGSAGTIEAIGGTATLITPEPTAAGFALAAATLILRRRRVA